jgi:hypothetical protein
MGRKSGSSVLKRQRELRKAEKAAQKKERRLEDSGESRDPDSQVASVDDLAGYGFPVGDDEDDDAARN